MSDVTSRRMSCRRSRASIAVSAPHVFYAVPLEYKTQCRACATAQRPTDSTRRGARGTSLHPPPPRRHDRHDRHEHHEHHDHTFSSSTTTTKHSDDRSRHASTTPVRLWRHVPSSPPPPHHVPQQQRLRRLPCVHARYSSARPLVHSPTPCGIPSPGGRPLPRRPGRGAETKCGGGRGEQRCRR